MLVKATQRGYYQGIIIEKGDEFEVSAKATGKWFVPVKAVEKLKAKPEAK